jgi:DNA mismatch repair protein MutS
LTQAGTKNVSQDAATGTPEPASANTAEFSGARNDTSQMTPMMAQYWSIKRDNPATLLFFRMGDFYELFFDDAVKAAAALDIALTKRGKHLGEDVAMCGVPVHAAETYLERLIRHGFKVAICEQMEDPAEAKKRGAKSVVKRDLTRIVTPGTITEDSLLDSRRSNHLAALARAQETMALAWIEMSTGAFAVEPVSPAGLAALLERIAPAELVLPETLFDDDELAEALRPLREVLSPEPAARFDSRSGERRLKELFGVAALDAFGQFGRAELAAMGGLVAYVELTQKGKLPRLSAPRRQSAGETMAIDAATRRNLELMQALDGSRRASLLGVMDRTVTGAGARLLAQRLSAPLTDPAAIARRHDAVAAFAEDRTLRDDSRALLAETPDLERALGRLSLGRGGPRDLVAVREGLKAGAAVARRLGGVTDLAEELGEAVRQLATPPAMVGQLEEALLDEPPLLARDGGFVRKGYRAELDEAKALRDDSRRHIAGLQTRYQETTGVNSLKVRHNNMLGYYVETTQAHAEKLDREVFIHRQTMANAMRFTTVELGELEAKISQAGDRAIAMELEEFAALTQAVLDDGEAVAAAARALAVVDVASALAQLAVERNYRRPLITDDVAFFIEGGRHPVVEALADPASGQAFVANDCRLEDEARLWLLTGPNMAGKSTFLRQNALIAIMAQMGSYVPAASARIGVVDRLFSRVGAADDLARGRSTFMVEMVETAAILNQAGSRALVILDEIGRGTATFDGLSIAWATLEHLHESNGCRALFATHYHELTALAARLDRLKPHTMRVKEWQDDIVFLYEVGPGAADRSYGIHVAQLAGLPPAVIARAEEVLKTIESGEQGSALVRLADDLPLFQAVAQRPAAPAAKAGPTPLEEAVAGIAPDELTPREALDLLYRLKDLAEREP